MPPPLAYLLTWTCKGTWLHGDERGSVDSAHNRLGTPTLPPDRRRECAEEKRLRSVVLVLSHEARRIVESTIREHAEKRGWCVQAINVRTNHVHVVVSCPEGCPPERAMEQFKAWSTRRMREAGIVGAEERPWTEHGSTRWLNSREGLLGAIEYVEKQ